MQISCPHCRIPLEIAGEHKTETVCASCGTSFNLAALATISLLPGHANAPDETEELGDETRDNPKRLDRGAKTFVYAGPDEPKPDQREVTPRWGAETVAESTPAKQPPKVLRYFGDYELLDEIARGGMGVVYKARQTSLNRVVAVKMILGGQLASDAEVQRFHTEAEAAANLHHPNIVAIHEVGEHESLQYFSMDYVPGTSLAALVLQNPLPLRRATSYVHKIAEAIHYAHQHGILHRDLKPSNVLVDETDQPRITDFGLAKRLERESGLTASGAVLGTPSYMPPEQAAGRHNLMSPASDVYSTGAILYELVTGRPPFRAESPIETLRQVLDAEPAPPSLLNPKVDRDLETICLKCLQKDRERRYATAQELADDLGRYLRGEPIHARPVGTWERLVRWCRRNPRDAGLAAAVALLLVTVAVGSTVGYFQIKRERDETEKAYRLADQNFQSSETQWKRAENNLQRARMAIQDTMIQVADELLPDLPQNPQTEKARRELLQGALSYYQEFLEDNANDPELRREIASTLRRVGEIASLIGNQEQSAESFENAIAMFTELVDQFPENPEAAQGLATTYDLLGELRRTSAQAPEAEAAYRKAIELQQSLVARSPSVVQYQVELARTHNNLGLVLRDTGRPVDSATAYETGIGIFATLLESEPANREVLQGLARCQINYGALLRTSSKPVEAEKSFGVGLRLMQQLVAAFPSRAQYRLELASCYNNLGNLLLGDPKRRPEAVESYRHAHDLFQKLADDSPSVPAYRRELANCCNNLATVLRVIEQPQEAAKIWNQGRQIAEQLVQENAQLADYQWILGAIRGNLGSLGLERNDLDEARTLLTQAVVHERAALDANPQNPTYRQFLRGDLLRLARVQIRQGDHAAAVGSARQLPQLVPDTWQEYHRAAMLVAQCVSLGEKDQLLSDDQRGKVARRYAELTVGLLRDAVQRGYQDLKELKTSALLNSVRTRDDFQELIRQVEAKVQAEPVQP